jgi:hypothetical protein
MPLEKDSISQRDAERLDPRLEQAELQGAALQDALVQGELRQNALLQDALSQDLLSQDVLATVAQLSDEALLQQVPSPDVLSHEVHPHEHRPHEGGPREAFVPLHTTDLVEYLSQQPQLYGHERVEFRNLASLILALLHHVYRQRHEQLTYMYAPMDPDRDTMLLSDPDAAERERMTTDHIARQERALRRANYHRLSHEEIDKAMSAASRWGVRMRVDFNELNRIEVYARGQIVGQKLYRNWRRAFRSEWLDVPLYQRLVVIFRTEPTSRDLRFDPRCLYLRMFKNIPQQDVDMVLPATKVKMSWWDHSSILLPSLYAIITTLWRTLRYVVLLTVVGLLKTAALVVLVIFACLYGLKSMFTYTVNTRRRYHLNVAQNLYYQTLDNNAGAMLRLLEEGEQQEACEAVLAYFAAAIALRDRDGVSLAQINAACRHILKEATGMEVQFDIEDAARHLLHLGLLRACGDDWFAKPLAEANRQLDQIWDQWFNETTTE